MKLEITKEAANQIAKISDLVKNGLNDLKKAGELVVSLIEQGYTPKVISYLSKILTPRDVNDLYRVGMNQMIPSLMTVTNPAVKYLAETPIEVQSEIMENGISVMVKEGGKVIPKTLKVNELNHRTCKYIFDNGKVRSLAAQKKLILAEVPKTRPTAWQIQENGLQVNKNSFFSLADLKKIVREVTKANES